VFDFWPLKCVIGLFCLFPRAVIHPSLFRDRVFTTNSTTPTGTFSIALKVWYKLHPNIGLSEDVRSTHFNFSLQLQLDASIDSEQMRGHPNTLFRGPLVHHIHGLLRGRGQLRGLNVKSAGVALSTPATSSIGSCLSHPWSCFSWTTSAIPSFDPTLLGWVVRRRCRLGPRSPWTTGVNAASRFVI
jgi:hypothetical protein